MNESSKVNSYKGKCEQDGEGIKSSQAIPFIQA